MRYALAAALLLFAASIAAQVREEVTVEVVDVPVYVYNNGQPVRNLTKDDFELFVNGKRRPIEYFDVIDFAAAPEKTPDRAAPDVRNRRLFLFIFDVAYSSPAAIARAQAAAVSMVSRALPSDLFAVVIYSSTGSRFIIPFTREPDVVRRAVLQLSPSRARDALAISITTTERQAMSAYVPTAAGDAATIGPGPAIVNIGREAQGENPLADILAASASLEEERSKNLASSQLDDFRLMAARLGELEGEKHAILFSSGINPSLVTGALPRPGQAGPPMTDPRLRREMAEMVKAFRASGILLHTVDVTAPDAWASGPIGNDILLNFASRTGGQFIHGTNDFAGALATLASISSAEYRLGFRPSNVRKGDNEIEVRVKNAPRGTTLSYRKGFSTTRPQAKEPDALLLADIIQNDRVQSGTPPTFAFRERPFLDVIVPARQLSHQFGAVTDGVLMLYVFDAKGSVVDFREKKIAIAAAAADDFAVREKLVLPSGNYVAKSLLRVGGSLGFAKVAFSIP